MIRLKIARWLCPPSHRVVPYAPTSKMTRAASKSMSPKAREGKPWVSSRVKHTIRYQAMLDASVGSHKEERGADHA